MQSLWSIGRLGTLAAVLGFAAFQKGGVWSRDWNPCLIAVGLLALFSPVKSSLTRTSRWLLFSGLALAGLQLVPLPVSVLRVLSPGRFELLHALGPITGIPRFATLTAVPIATIEQVLNLAAYLLVFLLVYDLTRRLDDTPWAPVLPFLAIALLEAGLGLVQFNVEGNEIVRGTWVNRDHFAGFLEMCFPFAVLYAVAILRRNRSRLESPARPALKACALLAIAAVIFLAIMLSLSRMGFLAALASLFAIGSVSLGAGMPGWKRWIPVGATALLVIGAFIFLPTDALIARFSALAAQDGITSDTRTQLWRESLGLIRAFPAFGCGLGGYESCFLRYKVVAPMNTADFAHNDYLQYWAELGSIGFLIGLAFCARLFVKTLSVATGEPDTDRRCRAQACIGALVAMGLHSLVDFNLSIPANAMLLAWISGIAAASIGAAF